MVFEQWPKSLDSPDQRCVSGVNHWDRQGHLPLLGLTKVKKKKKTKWLPVISGNIKREKIVKNYKVDFQVRTIRVKGHKKQYVAFVRYQATVIVPVFTSTGLCWIQSRIDWLDIKSVVGLRWPAKTEVNDANVCLIEAWFIFLQRLWRRVWCRY